MMIISLTICLKVKIKESMSVLTPSTIRGQATFIGAFLGVLGQKPANRLLGSGIEAGSGLAMDGESFLPH